MTYIKLPTICIYLLRCCSLSGTLSHSVILCVGFISHGVDLGLQSSILNLVNILEIYLLWHIESLLVSISNSIPRKYEILPRSFILKRFFKDVLTVFRMHDLAAIIMSSTQWTK